MCYSLYTPLLAGAAGKAGRPVIGKVAGSIPNCPPATHRSTLEPANEAP